MSKFYIRVDNDVRIQFVKLINSIECVKTHKHFMDIISKEVIDEHETEQLIKFISIDYQNVTENVRIIVNKFIRNINVLKIIFKNEFYYKYFLFIIPITSLDCTFLGHYNNTGMALTNPEYYRILKYISKYEMELEQIPPHIKTRLAKMKSVKKAIIRGELKWQM